jgi:hypothetical protein
MISDASSKRVVFMSSLEPTFILGRNQELVSSSTCRAWSESLFNIIAAVSLLPIAADSRSNRGPVVLATRKWW